MVTYPRKICKCEQCGHKWVEFIPMKCPKCGSILGIKEYYIGAGK